MKPRIGIAMTGSFCTFVPVIKVLKQLTDYELVPIFSFSSANLDTRFGKAEDFRRELEELCGTPVLDTIPRVEPLGPKKLLDALVVIPCTGNTLGKLANGIADSPVTLACKAHLRNQRPVILAVSTNDGLAGSAENIGKLLGRKHFYFVPFGQDDPVEKPCSLVAHMEKLPETLALALVGKQIQPLLL
ncbi:MAG: dipicolinate synthase subunit B [Oscillospiraceae bacterium]|nr:dipicolinate synthase subunit B [Oscillospiraceae bacterium]